MGIKEIFLTERICEGTYSMPTTLGWICLGVLFCLIISISIKLRPEGSISFGTPKA